MKIAAFIQAYNELSKGHLYRCLNNVSLWADEIFIYDDCSTDGSQDVYLQYTKENNIIWGKERNFKNEQFNKAKLLDLTLKSNPDWIFWIDIDTIADKILTNYLNTILIQVEDSGFDGAKCHNINLWRHPAFYRMDDQYNDLYPVCLWKNTGNLKYNPQTGLHGQMFPDGMCNISTLNLNLLHYGFADEKWIIDKYNLYKSMGQSGWALNRLITEGPAFSVKKVKRDIYPEENIPIDYDDITPLVSKGILI